MEKSRKLNELANRCVGNIAGVTLVEIAGDCRVLVERHRGVLEYEQNKICIRATFGHVIVCGQELCLVQMTNSSLVISGKIQSLVLQRRG